MFKKYTHKNITWIDVEAPTKNDIQTIVNDYPIHPLVANELLSPTLRPRIDLYDTVVYLILHFPTVVHSHSEKTEQEIDFIVGKDFILTAHYEAVDSLVELAKRFEVDAMLQKEDIGNHAGFLFFYILQHLYMDVAQDLESIGNSLHKIEKAIFSGREHEMVYEISRVSRELLDFKQAIRLHQEVLDSFDPAGKKLFGEEFSYYIHAISGEYYRIAATLESNIDVLAELRAANNSLLNTKTNDIMKILTIMAFVTFPLVLLTSLFGMNTAYLPIVGKPNDFWIIIGMMMTIAFVLFAIFKFKKWL